VRFASLLRSTSRVPLLQVVKTAIAAVAVWLIASVVFPGVIPIFGVIAAVLVVQPSVNQTVGKAVERSSGVIVGVLIAYAARLVFGPDAWVALLALVVAIFVGWALRLTPGTASQLPISAMLVLSVGATTPDYALERIIETIIGAAIGLIINLAIVPPVLTGPSHEAVSQLAEEIAAIFDELANALTSPRTPEQLDEVLERSRLLRPMQEKAAVALSKAEESLLLNPRGAKHRVHVEHDQALYTMLVRLVTRTTAMARAVRDHYDDSLGDEPTVGAIAEELHRSAHDLRLLSAQTNVPIVRIDEPPTLTSPLANPVPNPQHWILIGTMLEALRRVHEDIAGD
jgi:uncharacterized membrane protein YgaE (UPF0421/DUF939 family)